MQQVKKRANTQVEGDVNREHGVRAVGGQGRLQGSELALGSKPQVFGYEKSSIRVKVL